MKAPDKIYIQQDMINNIPLEQKEFDDDVEYIRTEVLLEWAKERYKSTISNVGCYTGHSVWAEVVEHLNEM